MKNKKAEKKRKYDILSPDGFSISRSETWNTPEEAWKAAAEWLKGYERQGYYSTIRNGQRYQLPLNEVLQCCKLIEV